MKQFVIGKSCRPNRQTVFIFILICFGMFKHTRKRIFSMLTREYVPRSRNDLLNLTELYWSMISTNVLAHPEHRMFK